MLTDAAEVSSRTNRLTAVSHRKRNFRLFQSIEHSYRPLLVLFSPFLSLSHNVSPLCFRDFLLYISPVFVSLYLPDALALHFLHYFVYIRSLHFFQSTDELIDIEQFFLFYYKHLADHYGVKSQLCTVHLHLHLKDQVLNHGGLSMTSCFARESYLGNALQWCHGKKYVLEQFITWYLVDRSLSPPTSFDLNRLFFAERYDERYLNRAIINDYRDKLAACLRKKKMAMGNIQYFARYFRGLRAFHSMAYSKSGTGISYWISISNDRCPEGRSTCFGEILFYISEMDAHFAFVKKYDCIHASLSDGLTTVEMSQNLSEKLSKFYGCYDRRKFSYKILPVALISNKVVNMPWLNSTYIFTDVVLDWEHD